MCEATPRFPRKNRRCSATRLTARLRGAVWQVLAALAEPFNEKPVTEYTGSAPRTHHHAETGTEDPPLRTIWPAPHEQPDPKVWPPEIERAHGSETKSEAHKAHGARQIKTPKGALPATPDQARSNNTTRRSWCRTSLHDKHEVNPRCDQSPRKMVDQLLPGRCSF